MRDREIADRLSRVRKKMSEAGVDMLWVRSTDRYLNEYVPTDESSRVWISGFTGSMGEVLIARDTAYLAVDGRYWLQADKETDPALFEVLRVPLATPIDDTIIEKLKELSDDSKLKVGFEPEKVTPAGLEHAQKKLGDRVTMKPLYPSPVELVRGPVHAKAGKIRLVDEKRVGRTASDKLAELGARLEKANVDGMLIQRLDEIAYLSNLRGDELAYQATFKAIALATHDKLFIGIDPARVPSSVRVERDDVLFVPEPELWA